MRNGLRPAVLSSICIPPILWAFSLSFPLTALGSITVYQQTEQDFTPPSAACAASDSCDLLSFKLIVMKKKVLLPGDADANAIFETDIRAAYETKSTSQLEKYAIVQQIRGCAFDAYWDGLKETRQLAAENSFGQVVPFIHKDWELDNDYAGAIYTGEIVNGLLDPFYLLRWNDDPASLDADSAHYYGLEKPSHAVVFATDLPGAQQLYPGSGAAHASDSSLEFRTCLFKTSDLPKTTDISGSGVSWERAIQCFGWDHQFVYDFKAGQFKNPGLPGLPSLIDPFCQ